MSWDVIMIVNSFYISCSFNFKIEIKKLCLVREKKFIINDFLCVLWMREMKIFFLLVGNDGKPGGKYYFLGIYHKWAFFRECFSLVFFFFKF